MPLQLQISRLQAAIKTPNKLLI
ncbi:protein of unknown function [Alcaligenes faecalis subsp. faecalis]|nr:protein of unknown function [Alcaligenes faecalis subsp. faecalis]